jgi:hypothetical protein
MRLHPSIARMTVFILSTQLVAVDDLSRVFVYAQRETPARSWMPVGCDGQNIAEVKRGFFFSANLRPGRHLLSLEDGVPISIDVRPGAETYVRVDWNYDIRRSPIPVLSSVVEERAKKEIRFLSYVETKRIHSLTVSKADPRPFVSPQLKTRQPQ